MKRSTFCLVLIFTTCSLFAQKIAENKTDDFTHLKIVRTTWEPLVKQLGAKMMIHVRVSRIDSNENIGVKIMGNSGAIDKDANLMLKMDNDSIVILKNIDYKLSCTGCGAIGFAGSAGPGFDLTLLLTEEKKKYLLEHKIVKVRVYFTDGYLEDAVKDKYASTLQNELKLISSR